jgi:hypothetical protein
MHIRIYAHEIVKEYKTVKAYTNGGGGGGGGGGAISCLFAEVIAISIELNYV